jgi:glycosyltransferase involved in cell wall biosynthesis
MKPKILMAAYTNYRRDPRVKREAEALVGAGYEVVFLASRQPDEPDQEAIEGVKVIKVRRLNDQRTSARAYILDYLIFFFAIFLHLLVRPRRYRLIHINNMPDFLVFAACLPRLLGIPVIHDVHDLMPELFAEKFAAGSDHWLVRLLLTQERWAGRMASAVLTVEDRLKSILVERGIPERKIRVLMNLPDERIFAPLPRLQKKSQSDPYVLVYHGTLARRLGLDIALQAVAEIGDRVPALELRIIGAGEEREPLLKLRDELGIQDRVTFSDGYVPVETIPGLLADADVGIVPLRLSDGTDIMLPTKLLEYVSVGIPCIVPATGTICRYFDETMVHFFEAEDHVSLANALIDLYERPELRESLAEQATERFGRAHRWSEHKKIYLELVSELVGSPSRSADDDRPIPK